MYVIQTHPLLIGATVAIIEFDLCTYIPYSGKIGRVLIFEVWQISENPPNLIHCQYFHPIRSMACRQLTLLKRRESRANSPPMSPFSVMVVGILDVESAKFVTR